MSLDSASYCGKIKFILMVNKQGQTRLAQYYATEFMTIQAKVAGVHHKLQ
jgi:hypothetical protein